MRYVTDYSCVAAGRIDDGRTGARTASGARAHGR